MAVAYRNLLERYEGGRIGINRCTLHEENGQVWDSFEFLEGRLLSELMDECLEKQDQEGFRRLFTEYVERTGYNPDYPVSDFDLIFGNIMVQGDDWSIIDYEWTFGKDVDAKELAFARCTAICWRMSAAMRWIWTGFWRHWESRSRTQSSTANRRWISRNL